MKKDGYFQCEFCGTKYSLEEAKKLMVSGTVEIVTGSAEKERLLNNAKTYIQIKEFGKAISTYDDVTQQFPDDPRGWSWEFTTIIEQYFCNGQFNSFDIINKLYENAYALSEDKEYINTYLDELISRYGQCLHTTKTHKLSYFDGKLNHYNTTLNRIDNFSCWLIYCTYDILNILSDNFKTFLNKITINYVYQLSSGNICPAVCNPISCGQQPPLYNGDWIIKMEKYSHYSIAYIMSGRFGYRVESGSYYVDISHKSSNEYRAINRVRSFSYCVAGRWILVQLTGRIWAWLYLPDTLTQKDIYKSLCLCQHCGGRFEGILKKACSNCGKPKNY